MAESAALLVDDVLKGYPIRQWVLSLPIPLRLLLTKTHGMAPPLLVLKRHPITD